MALVVKPIRPLRLDEGDGNGDNGGNGNGEINLLTTADWHMAGWADDPNWDHPNDGEALSGADAWDDGTGNGRHLDVNDGSPIYRASVAAFNGHAAVEFASADMFSGALTNQGAQMEYFCVAKKNVGGTNLALIMHGRSGGRVAFGRNGSPWTIFQGNHVGVVPGDESPHFFRAVFDETDVLFVDGTQVASGDAGSEPWSGLRLATGSAGGGSFQVSCHIAFWGVKVGSLTPQEVSDTEAAAAEYYGITT